MPEVCACDKPTGDCEDDYEEGEGRYNEPGISIYLEERHTDKLSFMVFMCIIVSTAVKTKQNRMFLSTRKMHPHVQKHSKYQKKNGK